MCASDRVIHNYDFYSPHILTKQQQQQQQKKNNEKQRQNVMFLLPHTSREAISTIQPSQALAHFQTFKSLHHSYIRAISNIAPCFAP
jgi:hypothetical protein